MVNRAILSRINAKGLLNLQKPKAKSEVYEHQIFLLDPETKEVKDSFSSLDKAVEAGFNRGNIWRSIQKQTKYKGYLWSFAE